MPFTVAHAAAALPFKRTRLIFSAVVVGTMAPDFEYFLRLAPQGRFGHTLLGLFVFTTPLALTVLWLFHLTVKPVLISLSPICIQQRLRRTEFRFCGARRFGLIMLSTMVGAVTHVAWDSFTHGHSWLAQRTPALMAELTFSWPSPHPVPVYKWLQHASTLLGLGTLTVWLVSRFRHSNPQNSVVSSVPAATKFGIVALLSLLATLVGVLRSNSVNDNSFQISPGWLGIAVVTAIAVLWWELVVLGATWRSIALSPKQIT